MVDQTQVQNPESAVAPSQVADPSPGQGEFQAPLPADVQAQPTTPSTSEQPQITYEQFQAIQAELDRKNGMLSEIQTLAQQQESQRAEREFREQLRGNVRDAYQRAADATDEESAVKILSDFVEQFADNLTGTYNEQLTAYEQEVQGAFWKATAPGFADQLMREHQLPPQVRDSLLRATSNEEMTERALNAKETYQTLAAQFGQDAAGQQAARMRQSGALAMGSDAGHVAPQDIKPGSQKELMPVLARIFQLSNG